MTDKISYLNSGDNPSMTHRLVDLLKASSQARAPAKQWRAFIAGLSQKGVKAAEMQASELLSMLDAEDPQQIFLRDDLVRAASNRLATIKEVALGNGYFETWRFPGGNYQEFLYIANSNLDNVQDEIERVRFDIEDLNFNMDRILDEPDLLTRLEDRLVALKNSTSKVWDFSSHHYSSVIDGRHGKNLVAHVRRTIRDDVYFIDEIQSDWAQKGRAQRGASQDGRPINGFESGAIPLGPYVTNTEDWAGMVLRRHAALAASDSGIKKFAWITGPMRNGGRAVSRDNLDDFYTKILPKVMDKVISKAGGRVALSPIMIDGREYSVPTFEMTEKVRQALLVKQPMYSRMSLDSRIEHPDALKNAVLSQCKDMLGSLASVRFMNRIYDIETGARVAGKYSNGFVMLSLEAQELSYSANHEVFHAAVDLMISERERRMIRDHFEPGSVLNHKVKDVLIWKGELKAAAQCEDYEEAAAHGFALWRSGELKVREPSVEGLFGKIYETVRDFGRWVSQRVMGDGHQAPADLFESLRSGELSRQQEASLRDKSESMVH